MKDLHDRFRNETRDLRYDLAIKRIEMRKLFTDPKTGDAALTAKQMELSNIRQQLQEKKDRMKIEWRKILTPEQIVQLGKISHRWGHKGWAMKGHCRHHDDFES
jgi:Spy/CpxP family protein refolding chaperone